MNPLHKTLRLGALILAWGALAGALIPSLTGCRPNSVPNPPDPTPDTTGYHDTIPQDTTHTDPADTVPPAVDIYLPPLSFQQSVADAGLDDWAQSMGATLQSTSDTALVYAVPSADMPQITFILEDKVYVEAQITVRDHTVPLNFKLQELMLKAGLEVIEGDRYTNGKGLYVDLWEAADMKDIHVYAAQPTTDLFIPYTAFGTLVSRKEIRAAAAQLGCTYLQEESSAYALQFATPSKDYPVMVVYLDKQTEKPIQTVLHPRNKYVLRSPALDPFFLQQGYKRHQYDLPLHRVFYNVAQEIRCDVAMANPGADVVGLVSFQYSENPDKEVQIQEIVFPILTFGSSREEITALIEAQGLTPEDFMGVLNVQTGDPYFVTHGYFFKDNTGPLYMVVTNVKNNTILASEQYKQLMDEAGYDFTFEQNGRYNFWHRTQNVVATADSNAHPGTITYKPKPE